MTSSLFRWRGLEGCRGHLPLTLRCEHGVWGKAPGARTDYRWLARSPGFRSVSRDLERDLVLGPEDEPRPSVFWKSRPESHNAVKVYRSRARDATGRSDFTEKQVLACNAKRASIPPVLVAFALLPAVAELEDSVWYGEPGAWSDADFVLHIPRTWELTVTETDLEELVSRGIGELQRLTDESSLATLFSQLLLRRTAWLRNVGEPLPPTALAALLLDLPPRQAAGLSLASWIPASRWHPQWNDGWNVLVEPAGRSFAHSEARATPAGLELARRLLGNEPHRPMVSGAVPPDPAPEATGHGRSALPTRAMAGGVEEAIEPLPPPRLPTLPRLSRERDGARDWGGGPGADLSPIARAGAQATAGPGTPPVVVGSRPGERLWITPPSPRAPEPLAQLYEFAAAVDRRWIGDRGLFERKLSGASLRTLEDADAELALRWVDEVGGQRPTYRARRGQMSMAKAHEAQWDVKVEVLRSVALVLAPHPDWVMRVGDFRNDRVPPLYMGQILADDATDELVRRLGAEALAKAISESRKCPYVPARNEVEAWIRSRAKSSREVDVLARGLAQDS